jgi:hypothetical protein
MKMTIHLYPGSRVRICGAIPPLLIHLHSMILNYAPGITFMKQNYHHHMHISYRPRNGLRTDMFSGTMQFFSVKMRVSLKVSAFLLMPGD